MKEQVSMMRSAWEVVTSWRRWARSRWGAEGCLGSSWVSWFDASPDELGCDWLSGVVIFGWGKRLKVIGRGVGCQLDLGRKTANHSRTAKTCGISSRAIAPINISVRLGHMRMLWRERHGCSVEYGHPRMRMT